MKRSTCLSAFLAALSVTSIASAAPTTNQAQAPKLVAQAASNAGSDVAQQSDGTGTGTSTTPSTGTADGQQTGETSTPQPAVSIGTSTTAPATDTSQAAAEEPKKKPKPRPFAGTQIYNQNSMTTGTVFRGQQQDYNPTIDSTLWLLPRYAINDAFQLRGRLIISYEYTNSDTTTYRNEPMLSDTSLQLFYKKIPEIPGIGVKPMIAANIALPTSKVSRARTLYFTPGVTAQFSKTVEHVAGGELMFISSVIYSHPIYNQRVPGVIDERDIQAQRCGAGGACGDLLSGTLNPSDALSYTFLATGEWGKFSPALYYLGSSQFAYTPKDINESDVVVGGNPTPVTSGQPQGPTNVRQTHYFSAWLDYNFNPWLTGEVGYWNSRAALTEAGTRGNIIWDRYTDTRVYLGVNVNIDNLMKALEGGETDAGIVRAKNTKMPMFRF
jgi:hypothetical protein